MIVVHAPRFNHLLVANFRGIGDSPLELDLTAGLTLLVAPNGTAKTSICLAADWLLTNAAGPERWDKEAVRHLARIMHQGGCEGWRV